MGEKIGNGSYGDDLGIQGGFSGEDFDAGQNPEVLTKDEILSNLKSAGIDFQKWMSEKYPFLSPADLAEMDEEDLKDIWEEWQGDRTPEVLTKEEILDNLKSAGIDFQKWMSEKYPSLSPADVAEMDEEDLKDIWEEWQGEGKKKGGRRGREVLRVALLSREADANDASRDLAERMLKEDLATGNKLQRLVKGIWKGNLFRGYFLGKNQKLAREMIEAKQNGEDVELSDEDWSSDCQATIKRFLSEYDEQMIHGAAGEWKNVLDENHEVTQAIRAAIEEFAQNSNMSEEDFATEMDRVKAMLRNGDKAQERNGLGDIVLGNYVEIAKMVRERFQHEGGLADIMDGFEVVIGEARAGVRTEAHRDAIDKLMNKWEQGKLSKLIPPEVLGGAASVALWSAQKGATSLVRVATAGLGGFAVTGLMAGLKERSRVATDRAQMARLWASGGEINLATKYDEELAATIIEGFSATKMTEDLKEALKCGDVDVMKRYLALSEMTSKMSDEKGIDLIRYSDPTKIEDERFALDLARAELRVRMNEMAPDVLKDLDSEVARGNEKIAEGLEIKDALFAKLRRKRAVEMGLKTGLVASATVIAGQELVATFSDSHYGLMDEIFKSNNHGVGEAKTTWLAGSLGLGDYPDVGDAGLENVELTPEQIDLYERQGCIVIPSEVETSGPTETTLSAIDYAEKYGTQIKRDGWITSGFEGGKGAYYTSGGDGVVLNAAGESVAWGGGSIDIDDALEEGKIRAFVSLTKDGQSTPVEVAGRLVNGQIEFVPEPDSAAAECFENGKFIGQYFEVVYDNGIDAEGVQHVVPMATIVGEGMDGHVFSDIAEETGSTVLYDVVGPANMSMVGLPLPLVRRREPAFERAFDDSAGAGGSASQMRWKRREEDGYNKYGMPDWDRLKDQIGGEEGLKIVRGDYDGLGADERNQKFTAWWDGLSQDMRERFKGTRGVTMSLVPDSKELDDWLWATGKI